MEGVDFVYGSCEDFCVDIKVFVDIGENFVEYDVRIDSWIFIMGEIYGKSNFLKCIMIYKWLENFNFKYVY